MSRPLRLVPLAVLLLPLLAASPAAASERRCGWIHNPTPANWWLIDRDGNWGIASQGEERTADMDRIPDLTTRDWVRTNGWYGYGFRIQPYRRADGSTGRLARHGGSMDGFLSNLHRYLDDDLTVIVLGNLRPFEVRGITRQVKQLALDMPAQSDAGE